MAILSSQKPTYHYKDSGAELTDDDREFIKQYIPSKVEGSRQGLRKPIIIRDYRIDNVTGITINKASYTDSPPTTSIITRQALGRRWGFAYFFLIFSLTGRKWFGIMPYVNIGSLKKQMALPLPVGGQL